jgi:hypothetical protein
MTTPQQNPGPQMDIPDGLEPIYSNLARISHSPTEILIDFAQLLPGENKANVRARVLMTPLGAKLLLRAFRENLARYEAALGEIIIPTTLADSLFRPLQPPEPPKD